MNPSEPNSSLTYYLHVGMHTSAPDPRLRVTTALLTKILSEPAFNVLRTQEQLGYIVWCSRWTLDRSGIGGIRIMVQSVKHEPRYLEGRVESFLQGMGREIGEMSEDAFEKQKWGLKKGWTKEFQNLGHETGSFLSQIMKEQFDFMRGQFGLGRNCHFLI